MTNWETCENILIVELLGMFPVYESYPDNYNMAEQLYAEFMGWA